MKKIAILMVLVMGLLALAGCSSDNTSKMVDYTLTTNVTDEATGDPVKGAAVKVDGKEKTTDANGLAQVDLAYGQYTVNVSADGYGNASAPVKINSSDISLDISLSEGSNNTSNLITNGDFASALGSEWETWGEGGNISLAIENEELVADVTSVHPDNTYDPKVFQAGIDLEDGADYVLSFDARADIARDITVNIGEQLDADPWFNIVGGDHIKSLTTGMQTYTIEFTADMSTASSADIIFELGTGDATTYYIDNVTLTKAETEENTDPVTDGTVTLDGEDWTIWSEGRTTATIENGAAVLDVNEVGDAFWKTQFYREGITVPGAGTYVVTFEAKADTPRDMRLELTSTEAAVAPGQFDYSLTDTMQTYEASFEFSGLGGNPVYKLNFGLGAVSDASVPTTVTIDNVQVKSGSALSTSALTVNVTDGTNALEGAEVSIKQTNTADPVITDASGNAVFNLEDRQYTVEASMTGYQTTSKTVVLSGDATVNLTLEEIQTATGPGYLYLTDESTAPANSIALSFTDIVSWENQSTITEITSDTTYNPCLESISNDTGSWGNVISFTEIESGAIAGYSTLKFKLKTTDYTNMLVQLTGAENNEQTIIVADGTDLDNGWKQYSIDLEAFGDISSVSQVAIFDNDEFAAGKTFLLTDVIFE